MSDDLEVRVFYKNDGCGVSGFSVSVVNESADGENFCRVFPSALVSGVASAKVVYNYLILWCPGRELSVDKYAFKLTQETAVKMSSFLSNVNNLELDRYSPGSGFKLVCR